MAKIASYLLNCFRWLTAVAIGGGTPELVLISVNDTTPTCVVSLYASDVTIYSIVGSEF